MIRTLLLSILLAGAASAQMPGAPRNNPNPGGSGASPNFQGNPANPNRGSGQNAAKIPEFAAVKSVPHGEIHILWYNSKTLGVPRRMHNVYTPRWIRTHQCSIQFSILFMAEAKMTRHGIRVVAPEFILDNLLADGKIKPMIVVMPNGQTDSTPDRAGNDSSPEAIAARINYATNDLHAFLKDLVDDIVPYVDSNYRTIANRENRAVTGLSFGGAESLWAGTAHLDKFAWIGAFSMGIQGGSSATMNAIAAREAVVLPTSL